MYITFLTGGILFILIEYVVNILDNSAIGAILSMIPIGFLSSYIVKKKYIVNYIKNIFFVICITLATSVVFYLCLKYITINKNYIISFILLLWSGLQLINYKYNKFIKNTKPISIK